MLNSPYDCFTIDYISSIPGSKKPNHAIPHFHNTNEIVLAVSGRSVSICGDEVLHLNAPYIIHYPVGVVHEQMNESAVPYLRYCFSIDPSYIESVEVLLLHNEALTKRRARHHQLTPANRRHPRAATRSSLEIAAQTPADAVLGRARADR